MVEHIGQTARIDKLVNEIINEERQDAYFTGAWNVFMDVFGLAITEANDYESLVTIAREVFRVDE